MTFSFFFFFWLYKTCISRNSWTLLYSCQFGGMNSLGKIWIPIIIALCFKSTHRLKCRQYSLMHLYWMFHTSIRSNWSILLSHWLVSTGYQLVKLQISPWFISIIIKSLFCWYLYPRLRVWEWFKIWGSKAVLIRKKIIYTKYMINSLKWEFLDVID